MPSRLKLKLFILSFEIGSDKMRFGVNYIPSKKWLYSWADFDENSIREDIKAIKNLGFDHVRTHIL